MSVENEKFTCKRDTTRYVSDKSYNSWLYNNRTQINVMFGLYKRAARMRINKTYKILALNNILITQIKSVRFATPK